MQRVLVTGATGFIGGRLVERLALESNVEVGVLIRDISRAARIARFRVEYFVGDLLNSSTLDNATKDCDTVFHCAHDHHSSKQNRDGIDNLIDACISNSVRRLVHLSSFAVYKPLTEGTVDENSPADFRGDDYADTKLMIENRILEAVRTRGLKAVVLQPTIVYGPFCPAWVTGPATKLLTGKVILPETAHGLCNLVYIDDLVNACFLAANSDEAVGEKFLISGIEDVTWSEYWRALNDALIRKSIIFLTEREIRKRRNSLLNNARRFMSEPNQIIRSFLRWPAARNVAVAMYERMPKEVQAHVVKFYYRKPKKLNQLYLPVDAEIEVYRRRTRVDVAKAKAVLRYEAKCSFERGMRLTGDYLRWAYLATG